MKARPSKTNAPPARFLASLGTAPQVITITLDLLLAEQIEIREAVVLHTCNTEASRGIAVLQKEFRKGIYAKIAFRHIELCDGGDPIHDMDNETAFRRLMQIFFDEIRDAHLNGQIVHIGIAGGRKVMAIAAMVVAQLLFEEHDTLWHLFSDLYDQDDQRLHATPALNSRIVPVPVLRYGNASKMLAAFTELGNAEAAIRLQEEWIAGDMMRRRREFVERWLSAAERRVVRLACDGLDNATIARKLFKSERTVANQLSHVYEKLHDWRGAPGGPGTDRNVLIATLAPYFVLSDFSQ